MLLKRQRSRKAPSSSRWRRWFGGEARFAYLLIVPSLVLMVGLIVGPFLYAVWLSLHRVSLFLPGQPFVGLDNYRQMLGDATFQASFWRTLYFTVVSIAVQVALGLAIAELLHRRFPGRALVRVLIIVPWAVPTIVNGTLWRWILDGSSGALNHLLLQLGLIDQNVVWLGRPMLALNMTILADTWRMLPLYILMFLAGRQAIPAVYYEAAKVDGASALRQFWTITLPLLRPLVLVVLVLRTVQTFRVFDIIFVMTGGGPANGTTTLTYLTYFSTFRFQDFGYGAALAVTIGVVTLVMALLYIRILRRREGRP